VLDAGSIARIRDVLAGGHLALEADRQFAASILQRWPWAADLTRDANEFYPRAAHWAVTGGAPEFRVPEAAGVIFAGSGYPPPGGTDPSGRTVYRGFHAAAQAARPDALYAYVDADPDAVAFSEALLADPDHGHVSAYEAQASDPAKLLGAPQAQAILARGPVMVQLQLCAHWWPSDFAAWAVAEYARLLRKHSPGSTLALTLGVPGGGPGSVEYMEALGGAGGTVCLHDSDEVAAWVKAAGLDLAPPGVTDVRGRELDWASAEFGRQQPVARAISAVALVP
jgi:hypothetical protein